MQKYHTKKMEVLRSDVQAELIDGIVVDFSVYDTANYALSYVEALDYLEETNFSNCQDFYIFGDAAETLKKWGVACNKDHAWKLHDVVTDFFAETMKKVFKDDLKLKPAIINKRLIAVKEKIN